MQKATISQHNEQGAYELHVPVSFLDNYKPVNGMCEDMASELINSLWGDISRFLGYRYKVLPNKRYASSLANSINTYINNT